MNFDDESPSAINIPDVLGVGAVRTLGGSRIFQMRISQHPWPKLAVLDEPWHRAGIEFPADR